MPEFLLRKVVSYTNHAVLSMSPMLLLDNHPPLVLNGECAVPVSLQTEEGSPTICIVNKGVSRLLLQNQSFLAHLRKECCKDPSGMTRSEFKLFTEVTFPDVCCTLSDSRSSVYRCLIFCCHVRLFPLSQRCARLRKRWRCLMASTPAKSTIVYCLAAVPFYSTSSYLPLTGVVVDVLYGCCCNSLSLQLRWQHGGA